MCKFSAIGHHPMHIEILVQNLLNLRVGKSISVASLQASTTSLTEKPVARADIVYPLFS
jgi:hypothetical protein